MKTIKLIFTTLNIFPVVIFASVCHPLPKKSAHNYLIGYGSLMEAVSRERTTPKVKDVYPVIVNGYRRSWSYFAGNYHFTALGAMPEEKAHFNAAYYPATVDDIQATDLREVNYCRKQIPISQLKPLVIPRPKGTFWMYVLNRKDARMPTLTYPIVQSYVDIFISGCMEIGEQYRIRNFAAMCITTTSGWSSHWINDRIYPRRPFDTFPSARKVDNFLAQYFPDYLQHTLHS